MITSKAASEEYREGFDRIFGKVCDLCGRKHMNKDNVCTLATDKELHTKEPVHEKATEEND